MIATLRCVGPDGTATGARVAGVMSSRPALVFVHGVGSTAAIWDAQLDAFGDRYACAAVELRGNGALPDPDPARITRAGFADDVLTVLEEMGIERFTLVGCSLGGVVALELWQRVAVRFDAIVMLGSFARYPDGERYAQAVTAGLREAGTMRAFAQRRVAQLALSPARLDESIEQMACKSVPCYVAATQATWTGDYRATLSSITAPALVAYGENDRVAPRELSEEIAAGVPGASLVEIPAAGHVANADNPVAFNAILRDFLTRLDGWR